MRLVIVLCVCCTEGSCVEETALQNRVDSAIKRGINYLMSRQNKDGSFGTRAPIGTTALAVDALISAGHTFGRGREGRAIERAVGWLLTKQKDSGYFQTQRNMAKMCTHGAVTKVIADVSRRKLPRKLRERCRTAVKRAVAFTLKAQSVKKRTGSQGGWRYSPTSPDSDLSNTIWQFNALHAAKRAGIEVPKKAIDDAVRYAMQCYSKGWFGYHQAYCDRTAPMNAAGATILRLAGKTQTIQYKTAVANLARKLPKSTDDWACYAAPYIAGLLLAGGKESRRLATRVYLPSLLEAQGEDGRWFDRKTRSFDPEIASARVITALATERRQRKRVDKD